MLVRIDIEDLADEESEDDADVLYSIAEPENFMSKDGKTTWSSQPPGTSRVRSCDKVLHQSGPKPHVANAVKAIRDSFDHFMNTSVKSVILKYTNERGKAVYKSDWNLLDMVELDAYLGLLIMQGVNRECRTDTSELWHSTRGRPLYAAVMSRDRFIKICRALSFDRKSTRAARRTVDRMCVVRELWDHWVPVLRNSFSPGCYTTVDEQLYPFRGRCSFKQFMKSKPAKYGLKFWAFADADTSYVLNIQLYTGKAPGQLPERNQGRRVVLDLTDYLRSTSGINITCDNFFTDIELGRELLKRNMTMVGTIRKNKGEIPDDFLPSRNRALYSTLFGFTNEFTLVSYVPKIGSAVILLSSLHHDKKSNEDEQGKPDVILDYNATKAGVDTMDQLIGTYTYGNP
ncbi:piggyBac transposable element-derived protein 4-like [Paramacrobiotus metropolitanus]|uniref:piggyBac transposable element-derived protein 4-like n=1 Tax=Paramacrobiotus metropolitanus TaxID=2943436 RepID=UPI0024460971|nr:piggyBac transposable element-derived protein 4-like [Paramacrobiotus metropolitanus]